MISTVPVSWHASVQISRRFSCVMVAEPLLGPNLPENVSCVFEIGVALRSSCFEEILLLLLLLLLWGILHV